MKRKEASGNVTTTIPKSLRQKLERIASERRWSLSQAMRVALEEFVRQTNEGRAA